MAVRVAVVLACAAEIGDNPAMLPSRFMTAGKATIAFWALLMLGLICVGCQDRIDPPPEVVAVGAPRITHSQVSRDLKEISAERILRMVTSYNSSGYFIHKGGQAGFNFELLAAYARSLGLTLQVVVPEPGEDLVSLLNAGKGDVVAGGLLQNSALEKWAAPTRPVNFVRKVVVTRNDRERADGLAGLAGLNVVLPQGDSFLPRLAALKDDSSLHFFITQAPAELRSEDLLVRLSAGKYDAVVVDDGVAQAATVYLQGLEIQPLPTDRIPAVWLVRHDSPELRASLNTFLRKHIRIGADGNLRRSQMYGVIYDRYFEDPASIRRLREPQYRPELSGRLSNFDDLIHAAAGPLGLDWRMVASLIYQESRFLPSAHSESGARGLMQVLPSVAGVQADSLSQARTNINAGLTLLNAIYQRYDYLDSLDRWRFTLAEYHAGYGHVTDARRIAMDLGRDPDRWRGSLAETLPLLMQRKYYEETRYGYYRGGETVTYVEEILNRYRMYRRLVSRNGPAPSEHAWPDSTR